MANEIINISYIADERVTFAFKIMPSGVVRCAFAKAKPNDRYSKKLGRTIAMNRLNSKKRGIHGTFKLKPDVGDLHLWSESGDKLEVTHSNHKDWDSALIDGMYDYFSTSRTDGGYFPTTRF